MILLAGGNTALLEGLAQALANTGQRVVVADSLEEAEEVQAREAPILTVTERSYVADAATQEGSLLRVAHTSGGALVTYREAGDTSRALPAVLARHVLADLVLPLERNRLVALAEHVASRARAVGRLSPDVTPPRSSAP
jgi:NAD(P)-dependent dehydrogenase (short-subunit alcohol dehydrogenase family)